MLLQSLLRPVLTPLMRGMFDAPVSSSAAWSPLALWPDGIDSPGMWISPRDLTSQWQDSAGTTPVGTPGTVADSANPVGLAYDLRSGSPVPLGPELVVNGDFSNGATGWTLPTGFSISGGQMLISGAGQYTYAVNTGPVSSGKIYDVVVDVASCSGGVFGICWLTPLISAAGVHTFRVFATDVYGIGVCLWDPAPTVVINSISVREVPGNHMLQSTSAARPLMSAYDGQTLGPGDTYDATGYPIFRKYDGVDDGMATAAFSAGTLINGMDCQIPVRLDSAAATYLISDTGSRGFFEWASGDTSRPDVGAGTPTYYVDGVAVTATKGALFTALTAGDWHILEARGLDLSTWLKVEVSSLVSYRLNGPSGDILLYPSTASTEDKDAARQYLADYYGVTLP